MKLVDENVIRNIERKQGDRNNSKYLIWKSQHVSRLNTSIKYKISKMEIKGKSGYMFFIRNTIEI